MQGLLSPSSEAKSVCLPSLGTFFLVSQPNRLLLQVPKETTCLALSDSSDVSNSSLSFLMVPSPTSEVGLVARRVFGVLGVLRLSLGRHLIVITERELCGSVQGRCVWKVVQLEAVPIPMTGDVNGTPEQVRAYEAHLQNMKQFLRDALFYFSYDFSLTLSQQLIYNLPQPETATSSLQWEHSEERFFWNMSIAVPFCKSGHGRFVVAVIDGFFQSHVGQMQSGAAVRLTLISRRSRHRAGTRFLTRGIDPNGDVANFVETEQILELLDQNVLYSWVVVRGSIPVVWSQLGAERIPRPVVHHALFSEDAFRRHMAQLQESYGTGLTLVNLIDQTGKEAPLGDAYEMAVRLFGGPRIRYVAADFHELTKGDRYENLSQLMDVLSDDITAELWFSKTLEGRSSVQRAVARVNCVDNLDRTNVVQSMLAKFVLHHQLYLNRLMEPGTPLPVEFSNIFNSMWTDNADAISLRYTGAAAMKTNFTRTGVHGLKGQLQDGFTAAERFVEQMLRDPAKQDAINLFVGKYCSRRIRGLTHGAAADGIIRVKAYKRSTWKAGAEFAVAFEINKRDILIFDWDTQKVRIFPVETLLFLCPDPEDGCVLSLGFQTAFNPKVLRFQTPVIRQRMIARILELADPSFSAAARAPAKLSVFVGSINMTDCGAVLDLSAWIPEDKDLYVISCTNAIFPSPDTFVMFGTQYFFFQVMSFLGSEKFHCCHMSESVTGDGTLILCRQELRMRVSAVETQPVTRAIKPNDPDWIKRAAYASSAHREVARSKSQARLEAVGLSTPRRRATVDIQKEVAQIGCMCSLSVDDGPVLHFVNMWDFAAPVLASHKHERVFATGQFLPPPPDSDARILVQGESKEDGAIAGYFAAHAQPNVVDFQGSVVRLECQEFVISTDENGETPSRAALNTSAEEALLVPSRPSSGLIEDSVVNTGNDTLGSDLTLSKIQASLESDVAPALKNGVLHISAASPSSSPSTSFTDASSLQSPSTPTKKPASSHSIEAVVAARSCRALCGSFTLVTSPLLQSILEPAGSVALELTNVKVGEWTQKTPPSKLRIELSGGVMSSELYSSALSESGQWPQRLLVVPWTVEHLGSKSLHVNLMGFASSTSSLGGFLSTITGTATSLAVGRLPLWPLYEGKGGVFRVPLFMVDQGARTDVLFCYLTGTMSLEKQPQPPKK